MFEIIIFVERMVKGHWEYVPCFKLRRSQPFNVTYAGFAVSPPAFSIVRSLGMARIAVDAYGEFVLVSEGSILDAFIFQRRLEEDTGVLYNPLVSDSSWCGGYSGIPQLLKNTLYENVSWPEDGSDFLRDLYASAKADSSFTDGGGLVEDEKWATLKDLLKFDWNTEIAVEADFLPYKPIELLQLPKEYADYCVKIGNQSIFSQPVPKEIKFRQSCSEALPGFLDFLKGLAQLGEPENVRLMFSLMHNSRY